MNRFAYHMYEMTHLALSPARAISDATRLMFKNPMNPWSHTALGRNMAASAELFERMTRRYGKPAFGLETTRIGDVTANVQEVVVWQKPYCNLVRFQRQGPVHISDQSKLLLVAPMSGHYATLLRGTVEAFLPHHDVYITDWMDARMVPRNAGNFSLDDYIDYLIEMLQFLHLASPDIPVHAVGVCQPSVPLIAATALMEAGEDRASPCSITLIGGPIDTRCSPTAVNLLAQERGIDWFQRNCIVHVPFPYPGVGRAVYPGFLQLSGFMAMNIDRHVGAHLEMFNHLVEGDGDSAEKHREFYDEYLAVMDLDAEFYLQTVEKVFVEHALPRGLFKHRNERVDLRKIKRSALMTIEGERDDISGVGQTFAAQMLCTKIPAARRKHHLQKGVGHYGVFNGSRFRSEIVPEMLRFMAKAETQS